MVKMHGGLGPVPLPPTRDRRCGARRLHQLVEQRAFESLGQELLDDKAGFHSIFIVTASKYK